MMALGYAGHPGIPMMMPGMGWTVRPFSHEEHTAFLDAMERYGQESTGQEWERIAQAVGNGRTTQEVRMHAHEYFVSLQMVTQAEPDGRVLGTKIKKEDWTYEQDMVFEHAMAEFEETDPLRWLKVTSLLPGKNHDDVRHRYQRLVYDVHKIEISIPMEVKYKPPKAGKSLLAKVAQKSTSSVIKPRGLTIKGVSSGGIVFTGRDGTGAAKGLRPGKSPSKAKLALMRLEELEKEVKPSKPFKTKIKGKGGGYILNSTRSSSPRGPRAGGNRSQRATSTASSSSEGKAGGAAAAPAAGNSKGGVSATGPKGGAGGQGAAREVAAVSTLKRSAVTRLSSLKSAKVGKGESSRRPLGERGAESSVAPGRGGLAMVTRGSRNLGRGGVGERPSRAAKVVTPRRKSERTRKRRMLDGLATEPEDVETEDEAEGGSHAHYNLRR